MMGALLDDWWRIDLGRQHGTILKYALSPKMSDVKFATLAGVLRTLRVDHKLPHTASIIKGIGCEFWSVAFVGLLKIGAD